jgi:hypothetical protein
MVGEYNTNQLVCCQRQIFPHADRIRQRQALTESRKPSAARRVVRMSLADEGSDTTRCAAYSQYAFY